MAGAGSRRASRPRWRRVTRRWRGGRGGRGGLGGRGGRGWPRWPRWPGVAAVAAVATGRRWRGGAVGAPPPPPRTVQNAPKRLAHARPSAHKWPWPLRWPPGRDENEQAAPPTRSQHARPWAGSALRGEGELPHRTRRSRDFRSSGAGSQRFSIQRPPGAYLYSVGRERGALARFAPAPGHSRAVSDTPARGFGHAGARSRTRRRMTPSARHATTPRPRHHPSAPPPPARPATHPRAPPPIRVPRHQPSAPPPPAMAPSGAS